MSCTNTHTCTRAQLHSKDLEVQLANAKLAQQEAINEQLMKKNEAYAESHQSLEKSYAVGVCAFHVCVKCMRCL